MDAKESHAFVPRVSLELAASVRGEAEMDAKTADPSSDDGVIHGVRGDVSDRGGSGPACEAIHAVEDVAVACRGWEGTDKLYVDVVESLCDGREGPGRRVSMPSYFAGLATSAGAGPQSDVLVDSLPDEARCHHKLLDSDSRMREVVKLTEAQVVVLL